MEASCMDGVGTKRSLQRATIAGMATRRATARAGRVALLAWAPASMTAVERRTKIALPSTVLTRNGYTISSTSNATRSTRSPRFISRCRGLRWWSAASVVTPSHGASWRHGVGRERAARLDACRPGRYVAQLSRQGGTMSLPSAARTLVIAVALAIASRALAQDLAALKDTTPKERAMAQTAMMKEKLALTDAQVPAVDALNLKYAERMEPIIKGSEGPFMKMRDARKVEQDKEAELKTVLSPDQFQKFQAAKEAMRQQFAARLKEQRAKGG